jgi:hypothetical protein
VSSAERADAEKFVLSVSEPDILARYFTARFGAIVRRKLGLPPLQLPSRVEELASGYSLSDYDTDAKRRTLLTSDGRAIADARETTLSVIRLVELATLLEFPLIDIQNSFVSASGAPLFTGTSVSG